MAELYNLTPLFAGNN